MVGISLQRPPEQVSINGVAGLGYGFSTANCIGVYGYGTNNTNDGNSYGGYFVATGSRGLNYGIMAYTPYLEGWAGYFQGHVNITGTCYIGANLTVSGTKNAAVKVDNGEYRLLSCQESPELWFEDFGEGQLSNGRTHIELNPLFLQTVTIDNQHPMRVFVQLEGDCKGVYVSKGATGFDVNELQGGTGNVPFSYRVVAKRKGYEDVRLAKMEGQTPEAMNAENARIQAEVERNRTKMEEENSRMDQAKPTLEKEPVPQERE